jgi:hypothetical protein
MKESANPVGYTGSGVQGEDIHSPPARGRRARSLNVTVAGQIKVSPTVIKLFAQEIRKWNALPST